MEDVFEPAYENMCKQLVKQNVLHADESPLQILHEEGKSPQSKSYMWLYRTSGNSLDALVLYQYERNRSQERLQKFLANFQAICTVIVTVPTITCQAILFAWDVGSMFKKHL